DYAHGRGLVHRSLTPHTIWIGDPVTPGGPLAVKVSDWQAAGSTRDAGSQHGVTKHIAHAEAGGDTASLTFAAPEGTWSASGVDRTGLDQFSLGAIAYSLFAGAAPAASPQELLVRLREQSGLDLAVDIPEIPAQIRDTIRKATSPAPKDRHETIRDFLTELDRSETVVVDEDLDPRDARVGDVLADGRFTVKKRLGKGSTALGLLVEDSTVTTKNKDRVLKVALDAKASARLAEEADVLKQVKSRRIVSLIEGPIDLGETTALLLESAGEDSMRDVLRGYGKGLPVDLLDRYGDDLLEALEALDKLGIDHRDVKPANIGVVQDSSRIWHVKLFDFSLSRAPAVEVDAGTAPYLDPFLGDSDRGLYDSAAERYAAAVVLYEMATGTHPHYGDDPQANPAAITDEITLEPDAFAQGLGTDLTAFFRRALARRARNRFGTVLEMRSAWRQMFGDATSTAPSGADDLAAAVTLATPLAEAGLSPRALSWFTGKGLTTVRDVVVLDSLQLSRMNGLTKDTGSEVRSRAKEWRNRFSGTMAAARPASGQLLAIEDLVEVLFAGLKKRRSELPHKLLEMILGTQGKKLHVDAFAPQVALSAMLSAGTPQVNQALIDMHEDWSKDEQTRPALAELVRTVDEMIDSLGGVAGTGEIITNLLEESGVENAAAKRSSELRRGAEGLLRIVVDGRRHRRRGGDDLLQPLEERRRSDRVVALGRSGDLLDLAVRIEGAVNDAVDSLSGVLATARSREVVAPLLDTLEADSPLAAGHRALRLGAALTQGTAAVSATGELHRRDLPAPDALRIALGELSPDAQMSPKVLQERVAARFPQLPPLPGRPQLDSLVASAGLALRFDEGVKEYVGPTIHGDTTMLTQRPATVTGANRALQE
ncbi:MAG: protein kinase, partial [Nocardioides sp.]|nr:protein kinase [Nocardioides sp.]